MEVVHTVDAARAHVRAARDDGRRIVLVPTMGNLHAGHRELVRRAHDDGGFVVATIYVNPFQFGPTEDFATYPRTFEADVATLREEGCHLVLAPETREVYPDGPERVTRVEVPDLGDVLCGISRPGFFRGVATVVNILFNMVQPDAAIFGEKDYQQLLVIRRMVRDLHMSVEVVGVPTVRERDGLAMSSRNAYLTADERACAPRLHQALLDARDAIVNGDRDYQAVGFRGLEALEDAGFRGEYFSVRRAGDLSEPASDDPDLRILAAAWLGQARLIDNVAV